MTNKEYAFDLAVSGIDAEQAEKLLEFMTWLVELMGGEVAGGFSPVSREAGPEPVLGAAIEHRRFMYDLCVHALTHQGDVLVPMLGGVSRVYLRSELAEFLRREAGDG